MSGPLSDRSAARHRRLLAVAVMNLLVSETRTLRGIERDLVGSDPRLAALFSTFTLVMRDEELPSAARLATGLVRQLGDGCGPLARAGLSLAGARGCGLH